MFSISGWIFFLASFFSKKNRNDLNYSKFLADIFRQNTDNLVFLVHADFKLSQQQKSDRNFNMFW